MNNPLDPRANGVEPRKDEYLVQFDPEKGTVSVIDEMLRSHIDVRKGIEEKATRAAAIVELERLGYTVVPPDRVGISLLPIDYDFIDSYDPDRERTASRQVLVDVLHEIQVLLRHGKGKPA